MLIACKNSEHAVSSDFAEVSKIVEAGATTKPKIDCYHSRYTADEMTENFAGYGFGKVFDKSDAYAQIICLERI